MEKKQPIHQPTDKLFFICVGQEEKSNVERKYSLTLYQR